jgi:4-hydroxyphenylpyruvate dioxygenase-like putative hemolysin
MRSIISAGYQTEPYNILDIPVGERQSLSRERVARIRRPRPPRHLMTVDMTVTQVDSTTESVHDTFPINGTDYVELYVGNAKQSALYYQSAFGYELVAYQGPETGVRDRASYLVVQNKIRLLLTTPLGPEGAVADRVRQHGDGVHDIALWVDDARDAFQKAVERGAEPAKGKRKSQIDEYLEFYHGPGVQRLAPATNDIIQPVGASAPDLHETGAGSADVVL